jgi:hypothetical protein
MEVECKGDVNDPCVGRWKIENKFWYDAVKLRIGEQI